MSGKSDAPGVQCDAHGFVYSQSPRELDGTESSDAEAKTRGARYLVTTRGTTTEKAPNHSANSNHGPYIASKHDIVKQGRAGKGGILT